METTKITPREQLLRDTLCTCIEGGSTYWLRGKPRRLMDDGSKFVDNGEPWHYTGVRDCKDAENNDAFGDVTLATIELGFRRISDGTLRDINSELFSAVALDWLRPDDAALDGWAADAVLQAGLFGSLVYG